MWHRECEQSIHVQQSCGLGLGGKSWPWPSQGQGLDFSQGQWPRPRPKMPRPRPRPCHPRPRSRPSWGVLEDPRGQGQASRTTRLLEYAKQKLTTRIYVEAHVCCTCLDMITIWAAYITRTYVTNPLLSPTIHTVRTSIAVYIQEKNNYWAVSMFHVPTKFTEKNNSSL